MRAWHLLFGLALLFGALTLASGRVAAQTQGRPDPSACEVVDWMLWNPERAAQFALGAIGATPESDPVWAWAADPEAARAMLLPVLMDIADNPRIVRDPAALARSLSQQLARIRLGGPALDASLTEAQAATPRIQALAAACGIAWPGPGATSAARSAEPPAAPVAQAPPPSPTPRRGSTERVPPPTRHLTNTRPTSQDEVLERYAFEALADGLTVRVVRWQPNQFSWVPNTRAMAWAQGLSDADLARVMREMDVSLLTFYVGDYAVGHQAITGLAYVIGVPWYGSGVMVLTTDPDWDGTCPRRWVADVGFWDGQQWSTDRLRGRVSDATFSSPVPPC